MDAPGILLRFGLFADLMLLVGIAGYAGRRFPAPRLPLAIAGLAAGGILLSIAGLVVLAAAMAGVSPDAVDRATIVMVLGATAAGMAWIVRIVALAAALALARHPLAAGLAGAVALATLAWSGHGAMDDGPLGRVHLVADIVHMIAAALWIGVLALLCGWLLRMPDPARVARTHALAAGFAGVGTVLVAVIVLTGVVNGWLLLGSPVALVTTFYGRLLLAKLVLFGAMLALAAVNRFRLTPALATDGDPERAWRALRRSVVLESGCGIGVLALIAWAGTLAPGG